MPSDLVAYQYALVQSSREVVFDFCETFREGDFTKGVTFDGKSISQLYVHIANTYHGWIVTIARNARAKRFNENDYDTVQRMRKLFAEVDAIVMDFIGDSQPDWSEDIKAKVRNQPFTLTKVKIITHVITHEFHHKGQILMLARNMGYVPPDTDMIRLS